VEKDDGKGGEIRQGTQFWNNSTPFPEQSTRYHRHPKVSRLGACHDKVKNLLNLDTSMFKGNDFHTSSPAIKRKNSIFAFLSLYWTAAKIFAIKMNKKKQWRVSYFAAT
jgi:hypothetical protein